MQLDLQTVPVPMAWVGLGSPSELGDLAVPLGKHLLKETG